MLALTLSRWLKLQTGNVVGVEQEEARGAAIEVVFF